MQSLDEHWIVSHGCGRIDHCVQHLIIAGGAQAERFADRLFFRTRVTPPLSFEVEDGGVALRESRCGGTARRLTVLGLRRHGAPIVAAILGARTPSPCSPGRFVARYVRLQPVEKLTVWASESERTSVEREGEVRVEGDRVDASPGREVGRDGVEESGALEGEPRGIRGT